LANVHLRTQLQTLKQTGRLTTQDVTELQSGASASEASARVAAVLGVPDSQDFRLQLRAALLDLQGEARLGSATEPVTLKPLGFETVEQPTGPVVPQPGVVYASARQWNGEAVPVRVSMSHDAACRLRDDGWRLDMAQGTLIRADGRQLASWWEQPLGRTVPMESDSPFLHEPSLVTDYQLVLDSAGQLNGRILAAKSRLNVFDERCTFDSGPGAASRRRMEPVAFTHEDMETRQLAKGVAVSGLTAESIAKIQPAIDDVLGAFIANREQQLTALHAESDVVGQKARALVKSQQSGSPEQVALCIQNLKAALGVDDGVLWSADDALNAAAARQYQLDWVRAGDVQVIAVPPDVHWSAMPQWAPVRTGREPPDMIAVKSTLNETNDETGALERILHIVFVPEDRDAVTRHEFVHLLEAVALSDADRATVAQAYATAVDNNGPFARPYGTSPREYLTTMSELFESDGVEWLKRNAAPIYEVLSRATNRTP
jgi:hypothetical protein